ncbi:MAG: dihydropteroate synthase [Planctomycetaceae bacterium]|nr:dihydropteroate synthase [Planctomycetaceae bacterium]
MGIVNTTPDSFSDGGRFLETEAAVDQALRLVEEGADIIDIGGESTRPGAAPVPPEEELHRVVPIVRRMADLSRVLISIDTTKVVVAREAIAAGAHIVNDISGLAFDAEMPGLCAETGVGVVCMHIRGTPQTMQEDPHYDNVVVEVCDFLKQRLESLERQGIPRDRVAIDPGIGFGKTAEHNLELLSSIGRLRELGRPVCIGHSRKRFLKRLLGRPVDERLFATVGVSVAAVLLGAQIIRVHDVAASRDAILACQAILGGPTAALISQDVPEHR